MKGQRQHRNLASFGSRAESSKILGLSWSGWQLHPSTLPLGRHCNCQQPLCYPLTPPSHHSTKCLSQLLPMHCCLDCLSLLPPHSPSLVPTLHLSPLLANHLLALLSLECLDCIPLLPLEYPHCLSLLPIHSPSPVPTSHLSPLVATHQSLLPPEYLFLPLENHLSLLSIPPQIFLSLRKFLFPLFFLANTCNPKYFRCLSKVFPIRQTFLPGSLAVQQHRRLLSATFKQLPVSAWTWIVARR